MGSTESAKIDVRVIAATQRDPQELVDDGRLRADLFYRLSVFDIAIPPLRDRPSDIAALVAHTLNSHSARTGQDREASKLALRVLESYDWPGNVRELLATVESSLIRSGGRELSALDLPPKVRTAWRRRVLSEEGEVRSSVLNHVLEETGGHRGRAAELLGVSRTTLWRWLNRT